MRSNHSTLLARVLPRLRTSLPLLLAIAGCSVTLVRAMADTLDKTDCNGVVLDDSPFVEPVVAIIRTRGTARSQTPRCAHSATERGTSISCRALQPSCAPPMSSAPRCRLPHAHPERSMSTITPKLISRIARRHPFHLIATNLIAGDRDRQRRFVVVAARRG